MTENSTASYQQDVHNEASGSEEKKRGGTNKEEAEESLQRIFISFQILHPVCNGGPFTEHKTNLIRIDRHHPWYSPHVYGRHPIMSKKMAGGVVFKLWVLLFVGCLQQCRGLITTFLGKECVYEEVEYDGDLVSGNFVVMDHGLTWSNDDPSIELLVTSPSGNKVYSSTAREGQKFEFHAHHRGLYKFCFINPAPTPETISFYIHVGHIPGIEDLAKDEHLKPVNVKIAQLREALEAVSAEQIYLKARDQRHRLTNESTNKRLITYTVSEYVCLVGVSLGQVYLIRRLFNKRIGYNRV